MGALLWNLAFSLVVSLRGGGKPGVLDLVSRTRRDAARKRISFIRQTECARCQCVALGGRSVDLQRLIEKWKNRAQRQGMADGTGHKLFLLSKNHHINTCLAEILGPRCHLTSLPRDHNKITQQQEACLSVATVKRGPRRIKAPPVGIYLHLRVVVVVVFRPAKNHTHGQTSPFPFLSQA